METNCRRCAGKVRKGVCAGCGLVRHADAARPFGAKVERDEALVAGGYRDVRAGALALRRRWAEQYHGALLVLAVVGLVGGGVMALSGESVFWGALIGAVVVFLPVAYVALAGLVNHTRVLVDRGVLRVEHGPLPWRRGAALEAHEIEDVWTERALKDDGTVVYRLRIAVRGGGDRVLLDGLPDASDGAFVEQHVHAHLGLDR